MPTGTKKYLCKGEVGLFHVGIYPYTACVDLNLKNQLTGKVFGSRLLKHSFAMTTNAYYVNHGHCDLLL